MIAYATTTRTRRNIEVLRRAGWRLLLTPDIHTLHDGFRYAIDNGAWGAFQRGEEWDADAFTSLLCKRGTGADWCVVPDVVGDRDGTLKMVERWLPKVLRSCSLALVAVQDGMTEGDVSHLLGESVGIFLGGTTPFKEDTMGLWGRLAHRSGCYYHVARVNSRRRIVKARLAGADSFDGTSVTRWAKSLDRLQAELDQHVLGELS